MTQKQMDKVKVEDWRLKGQKISCALHGTISCPKPQECDGVTRLCKFWAMCSSR